MPRGAGLEIVRAQEGATPVRPLRTLLTFGIVGSLALALALLLMPWLQEGRTADDLTRYRVDDTSVKVDPLSSAAASVPNRDPVASTEPRGSSAASDRVAGRLYFESGRPLAGLPLKITLPGDRVVFSGSTLPDGAWSVPASLAQEPDAILHVEILSHLSLRVKPVLPAGGRDLKVPDLATSTVRWRESARLDALPVAHVNFEGLDGGTTTFAEFQVAGDCRAGYFLERTAFEIPLTGLAIQLPQAITYRVVCTARGARTDPPSYPSLQSPFEVSFSGYEDGDSIWLEVTQDGRVAPVDGVAILRKEKGSSLRTQIVGGRAPWFPRTNPEDVLVVLLQDGRLIEKEVDHIERSEGRYRLAIESVGGPIRFRVPDVWWATPALVLGMTSDRQLRVIGGSSGAQEPGAPFYIVDGLEIRLYRLPRSWVGVHCVLRDGRSGWAQESPTGEWALAPDIDHKPIVVDWARVDRLVALYEKATLVFEIEVVQAEGATWVPVDILRVGGSTKFRAEWMKVQPTVLRSRVVARYEVGGEIRREELTP